MSTENFNFLQLGKNLYITWACFCNTSEMKMINTCFNPENKPTYLVLLNKEDIEDKHLFLVNHSQYA